MSIETGAVGELVFSTLRREAQPLFRYRSNDLAEIVAAESGEDGLLRMRFIVRGRSDQMLVLKGVNFFPQSLMSVIAEFPKELGNTYRVVRPPPGTVDHIDVVMETGIYASGHDFLPNEWSGASAHCCRFAHAYTSCLQAPSRRRPINPALSPRTFLP